jgi:hypothetical protein
MVAPNRLSVNKTKKEAQRNQEFAAGGDDHMFGPQSAEPEKPGTTAQSENSAPGAKFASGGKNKMFGYQGSVPAKAGISGQR